MMSNQLNLKHFFIANSIMLHFLSFIALNLTLIPNAIADQHIRPGLWEVTTRSDLLGLAAHIPSQQMQQLNKLAKQHGLKLPKIDNNAIASKICITEAMAQQEIPSYFYEHRSGCTVVNANRTGNRYQLELACANAYVQGNGTAHGAFINPEYFEGQTEFDSSVSGAPVPVFAAAEIQGRWIGEQCTVIIPPQ